jgi:hypothetical protein
MPDPPGDSDRLTLDIHDHEDRVGTVQVGYNGGWFFWQIRNGKGVLLQDGQEQREAMSLPAEMVVLLKFLLATATSH